MFLHVLTWRLWILVGLTLFTIGPDASANSTLPEPLILRDWLLQGDYDALERRLLEAQQQFDRGEVSDQRVEHLYTAFATSDPAVVVPLDKWIEARPRSAVARLARAYRRYYIAWLFDEAGAPEGPPQPPEQTRKGLLHLAAFDASGAIGLDRKMSLAYSILISVDNVMGTPYAEFIMRSGLAAAPGSYAIRRRYLNSLLQQPGDSVPAIKAYIASDVLTAPEPEWVAGLVGFDEFAVGYESFKQENYRLALPHYNRALSQGDNPHFLRNRGLIHYNLLDKSKALEDFNRAVTLSPYNPYSLNFRAMVYYGFGQKEKAYRDWALALELDPLNPVFLRERARALNLDTFYVRAVKDLEAATLYGKQDHRIYRLLGEITVYKLKDYEAGARSMKQATLLAPGDPLNWYIYATALYRLSDCKVVPALDRYLDICLAGGECEEKGMSWARGEVTNLVDNGTCPQD